MKKLCICFLAILLIALLPVSLAGAADLPLITDDAYLLSDSEYAELNRLADEIAVKYDFEIAVVTVDSVSGSISNFAMDTYEYYNYGRDSRKSGLLLVLSMAGRDYSLVAYGYGNTAFTDHGKDVLMDKYVLPLLGEDEYYRAFSAYLANSVRYLEMALNGKPFDTNTDPSYNRLPLPLALGITILLPMIIALIVCGIWKKQMKTAVAAKSADNYIPEGGFILTAKSDQFLFRTQTSRTISSDSSGKGGGTSVNSRGFSSKSGKF